MLQHNRCTSHKKLSYRDEMMAQPTRRWSRKMNIKLKGLRRTGHKKFKWKTFCVVIWPRKIAQIYSDIVDKILKMDGTFPGIIFSSQFGFPVLSHPTADRRRNSLYV
ncbi:hypothetical protein POM88_044889 [Heracleum sosnowskyi]|uniref:Uncharacterized protein n=1 Tax=Heracleum sosnowskyi TaxID=360622 RepID=A0AAD8H6B5_9APIA|nr:hypothetical protein POM88_044889 [Heracleum sosnowskyi]